MAIGYIKRLAGPYIGDGTGQKTFSFGFFVFTEGDVYVAKAATENGASSTLQQGTDYTVMLNADQEASPGGTITLLAEAGLANGEVLVIGSDVDYTQTLDLTNYTRFPPERISKELDRIVIQIQQLVEISSRVLTVPVTSNSTPQDLIARLLSAQEEAKSFADAAETSADRAEAARDKILGAQSTVISYIEAKGEEVAASVQTEGDAQADRLQQITDQTLVGYGVGGVQETWTLTDSITSGGQVALPNGMTYVVGRNHFRVSWNGLELYKDENFSEVGTVDQPSGVFSVSFDLKAGDVLNAWAVPLGRGNLGNVEEQVNALNSSVAELSRKAAFHNVGS